MMADEYHFLELVLHVLAPSILKQCFEIDPKYPYG